MAERGTFAPGGDGMTTGGLDDYLGPPATDFSNLPPAIEDSEPAADGEVERTLDCAGGDAGEAVCQIAEAEKLKNPSP